MYDNKLIQKGPSVDEVRLKREDGKVKVTDVLAFRPGGPSVEEARAAMEAAGETPSGHKSEAKPSSRPSSPDLKTRWDRALDKRAGLKEFSSASEKWNHYTETQGQSTPSDSSKEENIEEAESGFDLRFTLSSGEVNELHVPDRPTLIRTVKKFQAQLQGANNRRPATDKLTAKIEWVPTNPAANENPNPTVLQVEASTAVAVQESARGEGGSTPAKETPVERLENSKFVLEICQEDGEWVGRITYKNGAGTEEFRADTRKALDMKLLEGKAHATLKVREVLRRDQYHDDLDKVYDIPGYTQDAFDALTPEAQSLVIDSIASKAAIEFIQTTPEFFGCKENETRLMSFLHKRNLPVSAKNLKYAFEELVDDLEQRPQAKVSVPETPAPVVATVAADSAPTTPAASISVSTPPTPAAAPTTDVRKRGSFGFKPGFTSLAPSEFVESTESGKKNNEPSEKEARSMTTEELAKLVRSKYNRNRQF